MATYAIGDVQGCYAELCRLLKKMRFDKKKDRLWLVGDLINRGPDSLRVLNLVRSLGKRALIVLGNHELHFLAIHYGGHSATRADTFGDLLSSPAREEIAEWLCRQRLFVRNDKLGYAMTHAGIPHIWDLDLAEALAGEVEKAIRGKRRKRYFERLYGNVPDVWDPELQGMDRLRCITNYLTRMRLVDKAGRLDFSYKGELAGAPKPWLPWYELRKRNPLPVKLVFGHWAALQGRTGMKDVIALDTGCVWGRRLSAVCLETGEKYSVRSGG